MQFKPTSLMIETLGGALLLVCLACVGVVGSADAGELPLPPDRPIDTHFSEDRSVPIEMRGDWEQTRSHNIANWAAELQKQESDRAMRELRLMLRIVRLNDELIARFKDDRARHVKALLESVDHLSELGLINARNHRLKRLIDTHPGQAELAARSLAIIIEHTPWRQPQRSEGGDAWIDYATRRVFALRDAGLIDAAHPAIDAAAYARAALLIKLDRLDEARGWLRLVADTPQRTLLAADLELAAGRVDAARKLLDAAMQRHRDKRITVRHEAVRELSTAAPSQVEQAPPTEQMTPADAIELASNLLERAQPAQAERVLRDALAGRDDKASGIGQRLQVGVWIAMSQQPDRARTLRRELNQAGRTSVWPWYDGRITIEDLKGRLLSAATEREASDSAQPIVTPALAGRVHGPSDSDHAHAEHVTETSGVYVIQHRGAVSVVDHTGRQRWQADALASCVTAGRVITRCVSDNRSMLIARDIATGRGVWQVAQVKGHRGWRLVGVPAAEDGFVYCLLISPQDVEPNVPMAIVMTAINTHTGEVAWVTQLGQVTPQLLASVTDSVIGSGAALTAHVGRIYAQTGAGIAACVDARTGRLRWAVTYARSAGLGENTRPGDQRRTTAAPTVAPIVTRSTVLLAPRDRRGLLALDANTGEQRWHNPYDAVDRVIGTTSHSVVTLSRGTITARRLRDGTLRWRRAINGVQCGTVRHGTMFVGAGRSLLRLAGDDGRVVERTLLDAPLVSLAGVASGVFATVERPVKPQPHFAADQPIEDSVDTPMAVLRSPETHVARLPPTDQQPATALLLGPRSAAMLKLGESASISWRRVIPSHPRTHALLPNDVIALACGMRIVGIARSSGLTAFDARVPFEAERLYSFEGTLVAVSPTKRIMAAIDASTGRVQWVRELPQYMKGDNDLSPVFSQDERRLYAIDRTSLPADGVWHLVIDPITSEVERVAKVTHWSAPTWAAALEAEHGALLIGPRTVTFSRDKPSRLTVSRHALRELTKTSLSGFEMSDDWLVVNMQHAESNQRVTWVLHRTDTQYVLVLAGGSLAIGGDMAFAMQGAQLSVIDLRVKQQALPFVLPVRTDRRSTPRLLAVGSNRKQLDFVTGRVGSDGDARGELMLHRYRSPGEMLGSTRIATLDRGAIEAAEVESFSLESLTRPSPVVLTDDEAIVCDGGRLRLFAINDTPTPPRAIVAAPVYRAERKLVADGGLGDWTRIPVEQVTLRANDTGAVRAATSGGRLWVAVESPCEQHLPWQAGGSARDGDHIRLTLRKGDVTTTVTVGADEFGTTRTYGTPGVVAAAKHDAEASMLRYEVSLPVELAAADGEGETELLVEVFDAEMADTGAAWSWGRLAGGGRVRLRPLGMTPTAFDAAMKVAVTLPALPESRALLDRVNHAYAGREKWLAAFYLGQLRAMGSGDETLRAMVKLDAAVRPGAGTDTAKLIEKLAGEAGVDEPTRLRYRSLAAGTLLQRLVIDNVRPPSLVELTLLDGRGGAKRIVWGGAPEQWLDDHSTYWAGPLPTPGQWVEVSVPLLTLGLHDRTITGLVFGQVGGNAVQWGTTKLSLDGRTIDIVSDRPPAGRTDGRWAWAGDPRRGTMAHYNESAQKPTQRVEHRTYDWLEPIDRHMRSAPNEPYLAQWVQVSSKRPLSSVGVAIDDNDETTRAHQVTWGIADVALPGVQRRGPRPTFDKWVELRVPLTGTRFERLPIHQITFTQLNGRVRWGATELVVNGIRLPLITDGVDGFTTEGDWKWFEEPTNRSKRSHGIDDPRGIGRHGAMFTTPIVGHLVIGGQAGDNAYRKAIDTLEDALPALRGRELEQPFTEALERLRRHRHKSAHGQGTNDR